MICGCVGICGVCSLRSTTKLLTIPALMVCVECVRCTLAAVVVRVLMLHRVIPLSIQRYDEAEKQSKSLLHGVRIGEGEGREEAAKDFCVWLIGLKTMSCKQYGIVFRVSTGPFGLIGGIYRKVMWRCCSSIS